MGLRVRDRARYARQLLLPQIGEVGQARLLAAEVAPSAGADPGALAVARAYLERAGVRVTQHASSEPGPLVLPSKTAIAQVAGRPELHEAARALCGALAAVRAVQTILRESPQPAFRIPVLSSEEP